MRVATALAVALATALAMLGAAWAGPVPTWAPAGEKPQGLWLPSVGLGDGEWDLSVGARVWVDALKIRNLIAHSEVDLGPGLRAHVLARHNRALDSLEGWHPNLDEAYVEGYGYYTLPHNEFAVSVRVGRIRVLRFPYPDAIALFDQVPAVADLQGRGRTGYSGAVLAAEYAHDSGLGAHLTGIVWAFDGARPNGNANAIEDYAFFRKTFGSLRFEARGGGIASRIAPLGDAAGAGYDAYLGLMWKGYVGGLFYEKRSGEPAYTGVMLISTDDSASRLMGKYGFDYTRTPDSFSFQIPVARGKFGFAGKPPQGAEQVGEVVAVWMRSYWQAGLIRNFYEYRIAERGETRDPHLRVTMEQQPLYLWEESLVSPHTGLFSREWFRDRQGPAYNARMVIYRFYRMPPAEQ
jgi:hypothetical protein